MKEPDKNISKNIELEKLCPVGCMFSLQPNVVSVSKIIVTDIFYIKSHSNHSTFQHLVFVETEEM